MSERMSFEELLGSDGHVAITNKGVSMLPLLRQGRDVMLIEKKGPDRCKKMDAVLFRRPNAEGEGAYVMHRILRVNPDGSYWIVGDNCVTGETVSDDRVLGVLTGVIRDGKPLSFDDWRYKLYVNTWCRCYPARIALLRSKHFAGRCLRKMKLRK